MRKRTAVIVRRAVTAHPVIAARTAVNKTVKVTPVKVKHRQKMRR